MQKDVLIFLHMDDDYPGYIADFLDRKKIPYRIIRGYRNEAIPELDVSIAGLVFMGGVMSANDDIDWLKQELSLIKRALDKGMPILGHCLGGQLISKALGQTVIKNPQQEIGWHHCHRTQSKHADEWLGSCEDPFIMFHWHNETFALPEDAKLLFSSQHCHNQAYSYGDNVLAMQCHVEMTEPLIISWTDTWKDDLVYDSTSEQSYDQIRSKLTEKISQLNQVADSLYGRWVKSLEC